MWKTCISILSPGCEAPFCLALLNLPLAGAMPGTKRAYVMHVQSCPMVCHCAARPASAFPEQDGQEDCLWVSGCSYGELWRVWLRKGDFVYGTASGEWFQNPRR